MKKLIVLLVMFCLATTSMAADPNATIVVMDPTTNNGEVGPRTLPVRAPAAPADWRPFAKTHHLCRTRW